MVGEQSETYRAEVFPKSTEVSLLGTTPIADIMMQLLYKKADVVYNDEMSTVEFQNQHPGTVRRIQGPMLKAIPNNLSVAKGEFRLVSTLNIATEELMNEGAIDRILQKYNLVPPLIYPVARPYQAP